MKKKSIPVWVIILSIIGILLYGIIFYEITSNSFKYEVDKDGTILINKKLL